MCFDGSRTDNPGSQLIHEAKEKLTAIGKPAFLPVLGKMAAIRDSLIDDDSMPERRIESALMQADQCLRVMDGYLDAHEKGIIRPGERKDYIEYVLRIHYRRWMDGMGSTALKDMETMPGAYDASRELIEASRRAELEERAAEEARLTDAGERGTRREEAGARS